MSFASEFLPPVLFRALRSAKHRAMPPVDPLFDGDNAMFRRIAASSEVYGEYGVGTSTDWIYDNTDARILAVESSTEWAARVRSGKDESRADIRHIDIGSIGEWGYPLSYEKRDNFRRYQESIWRRDAKPDLVLIDGRFRVCCFLTSVLNAARGLRIVFDDYADRPRYHVVEELLPVRERCGRQVLFEVDSGLDIEKAAALREKFEYVID